MPHDVPLRDFATQLLELINDASSTTTYKYAVLMALIDLSQENMGRVGGARGSVTTRQLAERVVELYWPQTRSHPDEHQILRQNHGRGRSIVDRIAALREAVGPNQTRSLAVTRLLHEDEVEDLIDEVEWLLIRNPIPRLQRIGRTNLDLLFHSRNWPDEPPRGPIRAYQRARRGDAAGAFEFKNSIDFQPGVEERLAALAGLLRPLVRRRWARFVVRCNGQLRDDIESFLFDPSREALRPVRRPLLDLQQGRCFYCEAPIRKDSQVDHFLPWSRCFDDGLDNLVVAHPSCNNGKRDHFAAVSHLESWGERLVRHRSKIRQIASEVQWPEHSARTLRLVRGMYQDLSEDTPLWLAHDHFELAQPTRIRSALESIGPARWQ